MKYTIIKENFNLEKVFEFKPIEPIKFEDLEGVPKFESFNQAAEESK